MSRLVSAMAFVDQPHQHTCVQRVFRRNGAMVAHVPSTKMRRICLYEQHVFVYDMRMVSLGNAAKHTSCLVVVLFLFLSGCGKRVPNEVVPAVESSLPVAIKIAEDAGKLCPQLKASAPFQPNPMAAPPPPPSPALGTLLASDAHVADVQIMCSWPDPRDPSGNTGAGTSFPRLKGKPSVPVRAVTMPEDMARNTCKKDPKNCEQIVVPSRFVADEASADIRITRPTADGTVEVTVILRP